MSTYVLGQPRTSFASAVPAVTVHAGLILAAIGATRAVSTSVIADPPPILIQWPTLSLPHGTTITPAQTIPGVPVFSSAMISTVPRIDLPLDLPGMPRIDPASVIPGGTTATIGLPGGDFYPTAQVFAESDVDEVPSLVAPGRLRYPPVLAEAGTDGAVTLTFVIDSDGRVDPAAIEILTATHPGFVEAAKEAVSSSRFRPARKLGSPVRVRVRQTITFRP